MPTPSTRPDHIVVIADPTPGPHVTDSDDIQWWWPCLGPSASAAAALLSRHARQAEITWPITELSHRLGLGGLCSKMWMTLDRLEMFGLITFVSTDVATIRVNLPQLGARQLDRLGPVLAAAYQASRTNEAVL